MIDLFKGSPFACVAEVKMRAIINFINLHSRIALMFEAKQERPLMLIRPVMTRWTSHASATKHLCKLAVPLQTLVFEKHDEMLETIDKQDQEHAKAKAIFEVICDTNFWKNIHLLARILEPLAVTALTLQANTTRLDHVFLCLGKLYSQFEIWLQDSSSDYEIQSNKAVLQSLEKRWAEADQDLFVTAIILNVFIGRSRLCFAINVDAWKNHDLFKTVKRVYHCLFDQSPLAEILDEFNNYKHSRNQFSDDALLIQDHLSLAEERKQSPDPLKVWKDIEGKCLLRDLALRLLQIVLNTAAVERLFSIWSLFDTDSAAKQHFQAIANIARVEADLNSKH